jgi:hypothetical protein
MFNKLASLVLVVLSFATVMASAQDSQNFQNDSGFYSNHQNRNRNDNGNNNGGDSQIVAAAQSHRRVDYVEGSGLVVIRLLPDDTSGLQHQKWVVRLSDGEEMQAVYNSDMCERVPIKVGDVISMGGMFLYTEIGPMLHWLHFDPKGNRPDGYVEVNGKAYCKDGPRH